MEKKAWSDRIPEKKYPLFVFFLIAFLFLSLFSWSTSPFYVYDGMDSAVFKTMGQALLKGKIVYKDIFDHKGPYLYFINALGQWLIPGHMGIFLLQVVSLGIALWYMFRTVNLLLSPFRSFICVLLSLFILAGHINDGNQCEEWMMYAICIAFYYVCFYFVQKSRQDHPLRNSLIYGLCFGFSFFIRPNDAVAWIGGLMAGLSAWLIFRKKYKNLILNILCFIGGFSLMATPILIYFGLYHALSDMWYGLIEFNIEYSGGIVSLIQSCLTKRKLFSLFLFVLLFLLIYTTKHRSLLFIITPSLVSAVLLMGSRVYPHYFICFTPFFLLFFCFLFHKFQNNYWVPVIVCTFLLLGGYYNKRYHVITPSIIQWYSVGHRAIYQQSNRLFDHIPECEKDSIWNNNLSWEGRGDGNGFESYFSIFCHHGIIPCNRITIGTNTELGNKDRISQHHPKWIISQSYSWLQKNTFKEDSLYIISHYDVVDSFDIEVGDIVLLKRR